MKEKKIKILLAKKEGKSLIERIRRLKKAHDLLLKFKDGEVFRVGMVTTNNTTMCYASEIGETGTLNYALNVASLCIEYRLNVIITDIEGDLTYLIY